MLCYSKKLIIPLLSPGELHYSQHFYLKETIERLPSILVSPLATSFPRDYIWNSLLKFLNKIRCWILSLTLKIIWLQNIFTGYRMNYHLIYLSKINLEFSVCFEIKIFKENPYLCFPFLYTIVHRSRIIDIFVAYIVYFFNIFCYIF